MFLRLPACALLAAVVSILVVASACSPSHEDGSGALIVGVQADDLAGLARLVHVVVKNEGQVVRDEVLPTAGGLPKEFPITGNAGARIDVSAEALGDSVGGAPIVSRAASAQLVAGGKKLLRVQLESRCLVTSAGGIVSCVAPTTCASGLCAPPEVSPEALEDYEPGWAAAPPDICRPARHGDPQVMIGTGQTSYANLADGQVLQLEKGPQGGHHIWIAARMKNLRQSGSTTAISSRIVDDPGPVPPVAFVFTYERDEGSYCAIWGLRYQVDATAADLSQAYRRFLGKKLEVTVEVRDSTGASARDTRTVQIADKLLCPDGTDACNKP